MTLTNRARAWVMTMLARRNPSLPPRARLDPWGEKPLKRLGEAMDIARMVDQLASPKDWAATVILDSGKWEPLRRDLAYRLARAILGGYDQPPSTHVDAWWGIYAAEDGPRNWEIVFPGSGVTDPIYMAPALAKPEYNHRRHAVLQCAARLDGSYSVAVEGDGCYTIITPRPCLTGQAARLINRLARILHTGGYGGWVRTSQRDVNLPLPIPTWPEGQEYCGGDDLFLLALLRLSAEEGRMDRARRLAYRLAQQWGRSCTSGAIWGPGLLRGSSRAWDTRAADIKIILDPRLTDGVEQRIVDAIYDAAWAALLGRPLPPTQSVA